MKTKWILSGLMLTTIISTGYGQKPIPTTLQKAAETTNENQHVVMLQPNNIVFSQSNLGISGNFASGVFGTYYENNSKFIEYAQGMLWGSQEENKVGGYTYYTNLQPGPIVIPGTPFSAPIAADPTDKKWRVYMLVKGWENYPPGQLRDTYEKDYNEWPEFAPRNEDGTPKYLGSITTFVVANDLSSIKSAQHFQSEPMGLEIHIITWGSLEQLAKNTLFKEVKIFNKSGKNYSDFLFGFWSDPDILNAGDDRVAFTSNVMHKTFAYSDPLNTIESEKLLVTYHHDFHYLTSNSNDAISRQHGMIFSNEGNEHGDPGNKAQYLYSLRGYSLNGTPFMDIETGMNTTTPFDGDVLIGTGNLDENRLTAGDKRMLAKNSIGLFSNGTFVTIKTALTVTKTTNVYNEMWNILTQPSVEKMVQGNIEVPTMVRSTPLENGTNKIQISGLSFDIAYVKMKFFMRTIHPTNETFFFNDQGQNGDDIAGDGIYTVTLPFLNFPDQISVDLTVVQNGIVKTVFDWIENLEVINNSVFANFEYASDNVNQNGKVEPGEAVQFKLNIQSTSETELSGFRVFDSPYAKSFESFMSEKNLILSGVSQSFPTLSTYTVGVSPTIEFQNRTEIQDEFPLFYRIKNHNWNPGKLFKQLVPYFIQKPDVENLQVLLSPQNNLVPQGKLGVKLYDNLIFNSEYQVQVISADHMFDYYLPEVSIGKKNYEIHIMRNALDGEGLDSNVAVFKSFALPDEHGYNQQVFDNMLLTKGTVRDKAELKVTPTVSNNLTSFYTKSGFQYGALSFGSNIHNISELYRKIEIRFTQSPSQKLYVYTRGHINGNYFYEGLHEQNIEIWNVSDPSNEFQINAAFVEQYGSPTNDLVWSPTLGSDREYLMIFESTYDPNQTIPLYAQNFLNVRYSADQLLFAWLSKKDLNLPAYLPGEKITIEMLPALLPGTIFTFNSASLQKVGTSVGELEKITEFQIEQNYPNPFNPTTTVPFLVPTSGQVSFKVFNLLGQEVWNESTFISTSGRHLFNWKGVNQSGQAVSSGLYFYQLKFGDKTMTKSMMLMK